jgi:hypothetical protein
MNEKKSKRTEKAFEKETLLTLYFLKLLKHLLILWNEY